MVKPGVFKMGASCGWHASRGSIWVVAVTENYSENSQSNPNTLPYQPNAVQWLASCLISNFKQLAADTDDRSRSTIVNQASTEETISYDIYQKLNLFKTRAGDFYSTYGASTSSAGSLAYTNDQNPIRYSRALGDALREKLLKDQWGTTTDFDITSRFTSVTLLTTVDIPYTTGKYLATTFYLALTFLI